VRMGDVVTGAADRTGHLTATSHDEPHRGNRGTTRKDRPK